MMHAQQKEAAPTPLRGARGQRWELPSSSWREQSGLIPKQRDRSWDNR
jgi:hypothetical protein